MRKSPGDAVFQFLVDNYLVVILILMVLPLWRVFMLSVTPQVDLSDRTFGMLVPPSRWSLAAYKQFLTHPSFLVAAGNSFLILGMGVSLSLFLTVPLAYVLSVRNLPGRRFLHTLVMIPFLFNPGLIPSYLVVTGLGLYDRLLAVVVPGAINVYNVFVMKNFFEGLPEELKEAARIDGASELYILFKVVIPLSKPILLTIGLFYGVHFWNDFFNAILYLGDARLQPLPILLRNILQAANFNEYVDIDVFSEARMESLKAASVFLTALPMLLIYPWIQRYFTKGTLSGGLKG
ncbi:MAG TPA: carbohydrate ABC transporter permease [Spirochaetia bacterium]|nr:carbohydrate ABC transporter permease [Spirochaetales bacterium]HRY79157.1 carbohydrate ABC transporter permease [Spirochaetia bacterium]